MLQYNIVIDKREIHFDFTASPKGHSTATCIKLLFHRLKIQPLHGVTVYYQYHLLFLLFLSFLVFCLFCFRFVFCFHALVGAFRRCSLDLFLSSRPRIGLATTYILLGMVEARSVNVKNTTHHKLFDALLSLWMFFYKKNLNAA